MKVLIIGGTGNISAYVVKKCLDRGMDVTIYNRGNHNQDVPKDVQIIIGDINNEVETKNLFKDQSYDCVCQFVAFKKEQVERDVRLFKDITKQYIFISSASAYHKPVEDYPITEETPLHNPYWGYSRDKIECEIYLNHVNDLNTTIVRPSHTYNNHMVMAVMTRWGYEYAHLKRLMDGRPVIIPGDGTSLWTITHSSDFANSFVDLIGHKEAYNDVFHITSDKLYTWEQLNHLLAKSLGVKPQVIHIPTDFIIQHMPEMEGPLLGDKTWSVLFDNSKIKKISQSYTSIVGYEDVVDDVVAYYKTHKHMQKISEDYEKMYDRLIERYEKHINQ